MPNNGRDSANVRLLRDDLNERREQIRLLHERGLDGLQVCARWASQVDSVVARMFNASLAELDTTTANQFRSQVAIVGLGSYGRRQCAPFSDVDLMVLHQGQPQEEVARVLRPLTQGIFDAGLQLGHSIRTVSEAVQLARTDAVICTSLIDSRLLLGHQPLHDNFRTTFAKMVQRRSKSLCKFFLEARATERNQYGETVYLLEPHVKRSRGGLRDLNLLRWLGFAEHGATDPDRLHLMGTMSKFDHRRLLSARAFLLRLRNEMHFHGQSSRDLLDRAEQLRIAERFGYQGGGGLLPVEAFMRDYFRHTNHVWQLVRRREASLHVESRVSRVFDPVLGKSVDGDYRVGISNVSATSSGLAKLKQDIREVMRLIELSVREGKRLDHATWSALLLAAPEFPNEVTAEVGKQFLGLLTNPQHVGEALRVLHELGFLDKIIPAMRHARCLLQFNQYHKYTVDEHCLRSVRKATEFVDRKDTLGKAYREVDDNRILHLALLIHDLGKGFEEDHSEVGKRLAEETAILLKLDERATSSLVFLVHKHLMMSHLAFRRDTGDEQLLRRFAEEVGDLDRLRMLLVLSCADLAAVGPGVLNDWKVDVLADLYSKTAKLLQKDGLPAQPELEAYRDTILGALTSAEQSDPWFAQQNETLPPSYLAGRDVSAIVETLRRFRQLAESEAGAWSFYLPETKTIQFIAGIDHGIGRGVFSSMAGALSSQGMQILSAQTDVLANELLMLRYVATDPESPDGPTLERLESTCRALVASVDSDEPPRFRRVWGQEQAEASIQLSALPNDVRIDNHSSDVCTVIEVFTLDRPGLLYTLARRLHDLSLVIRHAKIGTFLDQVVDVFYVTDHEDKKITDGTQLAHLHDQLLAVINSA